MNWDDVKSKNHRIKTLINELEHAACDCDLAYGKRCKNHVLANELRDEIVKTVTEVENKK